MSLPQVPVGRRARKGKKEPKCIFNDKSDCLSALGTRKKKRYEMF
jgi:hypothetical protein